MSSKINWMCGTKGLFIPLSNFSSDLSSRWEPERERKSEKNCSTSGKGNDCKLHTGGYFCGFYVSGYHYFNCAMDGIWQNKTLGRDGGGTRQRNKVQFRFMVHISHLWLLFSLLFWNPNRSVSNALYCCLCVVVLSWRWDVVSLCVVVAVVIAFAVCCCFVY